MQRIDHIIDAVANYISKRSTDCGTFYFSKIELKYAYSQIQLDTQLQKHCNFNILGAKATGTYRFLIGFYGRTGQNFKETIDVTLEVTKLEIKFAFLDDIAVITKSIIAENEKELDKILYLLDKENLAKKVTQIANSQRRK